MSSFDLQRQESLRRRWRLSAIGENLMLNHSTTSYNHHHHHNKVPFNSIAHASNPKPTFPGCGTFDEDLVAAVVPPVTVVLEGRSICQRISLHKHGSYQSLARALRHMFEDTSVGSSSSSSLSDHDCSKSFLLDSNQKIDGDTNVDLSNAVPGHLIAYEDMENDLLLVGDLNWKDFVKVAKRIRILPAKSNSRKQKEES